LSKSYGVILRMSTGTEKSRYRT